MKDISDRHMRPVEGLGDGASAAKLRVRIRLGTAQAAAAPGQLTLSCLVNLLCRMTDLVGEVQLCGPKAPLQIMLPSHPASGSDLLEAAADLVRWAVGERVAVAFGAGARADIVLLIGTERADEDPDVAVAALGAGWRAWAGNPACAPKDAPPQDDNPLGPFLAACFLAGEVFKRARGVKGRGRFVTSLGYSLWSGASGEDWAALDDGPPLAGRRVPPFYLVGAGAVGQALAYALGAARLKGLIVAIDDDRHDVTNLNRCFLAGGGDDGERKVECVERFLRAAGLDSFGIPRTLAQYVADLHPELPPELQESETDGLYETVVSCVDKGHSRQDVQGLWPKWVFGGSTEGLNAKTMVYDLSQDGACLACHNPPEPDGEQLRLLEQQVRRLKTRAERRDFLRGRVEEGHLEAVLDYLERPSCGSVGEAKFREAARDHGRAFSVSFVSMAAGLLLASAMLRTRLFGDSAPDRPMLASLSFLNGRPLETVLSVDAGCLKCEEAARLRWRARWSV